MKLKCGYNFNGSYNGYAFNIEANKLLDMQNDFKHPYYVEDFKYPVFLKFHNIEKDCDGNCKHSDKYVSTVYVDRRGRSVIRYAYIVHAGFCEAETD